MSKGRVTREHILSTAFELASKDGLDSLTIGLLAKASGMSKSGLFAHFNSKENLQVAVLEYAGDYFSLHVIQPARLAEPENIEKKLRLLLTNWLSWNQSFQGSCMFLDARKEGRQGNEIIQTTLDKITRRWLDYLCHQIEKGKQSGELKADLDAWQSVYRLYGIYLSSHLFLSLALETPERDRFWLGIEDLLAEWRAK
ncbi:MULTISPECIES: TetR/AcrR family transcriptional regulator [Photobacterium]|jgi:AcrR family transcriptional regulator|uniref:TetR family transcriptional regulator n=1 Tax=Photobacterium indicum TaxID=81447 RepID=A0A2T3L7B6_9GAMM|nr:TetR/AcrR family transcriptional regulator [Photobacterium indicum]PSV46272.1 TetR family transcriptional regulator [Photobacterium indicum]